MFFHLSCLMPGTELGSCFKISMERYRKSWSKAAQIHKIPQRCINNSSHSGYSDLTSWSMRFMVSTVILRLNRSTPSPSNLLEPRNPPWKFLPKWQAPMMKSTKRPNLGKVGRLRIEDWGLKWALRDLKPEPSSLLTKGDSWSMLIHWIVWVQTYSKSLRVRYVPKLQLWKLFGTLPLLVSALTFKDSQQKESLVSNHYSVKVGQPEWFKTCSTSHLNHRPLLIIVHPPSWFTTATTVW